MRENKNFKIRLGKGPGASLSNVLPAKGLDVAREHF
jgi:hypothetical protein